jgi:hypothetical protein
LDVEEVAPEGGGEKGAGAQPASKKIAAGAKIGSAATTLRAARPTVCALSILRPTHIFVARFSEGPLAIIDCGARPCNREIFRSAGCGPGGQLNSVSHD